MFQDRHASAGEIGAAFVLGSLTGAVLALLFAPRSGEETRSRIGESLREGRDRLADRGRSLIEDARSTLTRAGSSAAESVGLTSAAGGTVPGTLEETRGVDYGVAGGRGGTGLGAGGSASGASDVYGGTPEDARGREGDPTY